LTQLDSRTSLDTACTISAAAENRLPSSLGLQASPHAQVKKSEESESEPNL